LFRIAEKLNKNGQSWRIPQISRKFPADFPQIPLPSSSSFYPPSQSIRFCWNSSGTGSEIEKNKSSLNNAEIGIIVFGCVVGVGVTTGVAIWCRFD